MRTEDEIRRAWEELCAAEQQCFGDSLTFATVAPILRKLLRASTADATRLSKALAEFGEKTGASPWT